MAEIPDIVDAEIKLQAARKKIDSLREYLQEWLDELYDESTKAQTVLAIYESHFGQWAPTREDRT